MRRDVVFDYLFLLQTSWKDRFFIEVSTQYLYLCEGIISFIISEIPSYPPSLLLLWDCLVLK